MNSAAELDALFPPPEGAGDFSRKFSLLNRGGRLLLAVPEGASAAAATLDLYPAQRPVARLVKCALHGIIAGRLPRPLRAHTHRFTCSDPFTEFLCSLAPALKTEAGQIGIFAGNPKVSGRRWLVLLFDGGAPVAAVKAGVDEAGRMLVAKERMFLEQVRLPGVEMPRASCTSERVTTFAMDFLHGESPRSATPRAVHEVLRGWIREDPARPLHSVPAWIRLAEAGAGDPALADLSIRSVVMHGDFAPWNVKIDGGWRVFDWERGEAVGVPCWDWLHFVIQPAILVEHLGPTAIAERLEALFEAEEFREYARATRVAGYERRLAMGYLRYCHRVQRQVAGTAALEELERHLAGRWTPG